ncbi:MAG: DUF4375 domain-containing protein [Candidatus Sulfotelmatobacter sp.]
MRELLMAEKSFLDRAAAYAYEELDRLGGDLSKLDVPQQTVAILYSEQAIIDNGGFQYLFENDLPGNLPYSKVVEAYRRIGAHGAAERLEKAVAMFPFESPHLHQEKRLEFMEALGEQSEFVELGDEVCGDKKVWAALEEYAKTNAASFPIIVN